MKIAFLLGFLVVIVVLAVVEREKAETQAELRAEYDEAISFTPPPRGDDPHLPTLAVVIRDCETPVAIVFATAIGVVVVTAEEYAEVGDSVEKQIARLGTPGREIVGRIDRELRKGCAKT